MGWFRRHYGAGPLHLLSLVACLAFAGYVATRILAGPEAIRILVWFAGAAVAHDLILWPLYAVADRGAVRGRPPPPRPPAEGAVDQPPAGARRAVGGPARGVVPARLPLVGADLPRRVRV